MRIGIFDSGLGGLVILRSLLRKSLSKFDFVYLGDTKHLPYGGKSQRQIYQLTKRAVEYLFQQDCALVIVACNTASSQALRKLQREYLPKSKYADRKILGVIRPTAEVVGKLGGTVVIIGTKATVQSRAYLRELKHVSKNLKVIQLATPKLVPLLERNQPDRAVLAVRQYLSQLKSQPDYLLLACTHYGLLKKQIKNIMGPKVRVVAQEDLIPAKLQAYLHRHPEINKQLSKEKQVQILVTKTNSHYRKLLSQWFGKKTKLKLAKY